MKKLWEELTIKEKQKVYDKAIESGEVEDTFDGFSKTMMNCLFNSKTGDPIEII